VHHPSIEKLADSYKQLMASFGLFSMYTLTAVDARLSSNSAGDATYNTIENQLVTLTNQRNALAADIRAGLNSTQFDGVKLSENQIKAWTQAADDLIAQAQALAASS
jgi:hypothetical protein